MALTGTELAGAGSALAGSDIRMAPTLTKSLTFASGSGTISKGAALAVSSGEWILWVNGQTPRGFAAADVTLDGSDEVKGSVMLQGAIHRDDVPVPAGGTTQAQLDTALSSLSSEGFQIDGLELI